MAEPRYGDFDGVPSRYNANEAWVYDGKKDGWVEIDHASHNNAVRRMIKEDFDYLYPGLPPLPSTAFQSSSDK
jgi:hypothetical protein